MKLHGDEKPIYSLGDFGQVAPQFGFSAPINKIVIKNKEAFWLCVMISKGGAGALDGVPFETDEDFTKFAKKELKKVPIEVVRFRMKCAEMEGLTYQEYMQKQKDEDERKYRLRVDPVYRRRSLECKDSDR